MREGEAISVPKLAQLWGCHPRTIMRQISQGRFASPEPPFFVGHSLRIPMVTVKDYKRRASVRAGQEVRGAH